MDDMIFIVRTKEEAQTIKKLVEQIINKNLLEMNKKSQIIPTKKGITFLGWTFTYNPKGKIIQKISMESKKRIIKKVKYRTKRIKTNSERQNVIASYKGHLQGGNTFNLFNRLKIIILNFKNINNWRFYEYR